MVVRRGGWVWSKRRVARKIAQIATYKFAIRFGK